MTTGQGRASPFRPKLLLRGLILIATLIAVGLLIEKLGLRSMLETHWIDSQVRGRGLVGEALFVGVGLAFTAIGLPRQIVAFLGGYAFGLVIGTGLAVLATLGGAVLAFYYARFMGRSLLRPRFPERLRRLDSFLSENTATVAVLLRLAPFTNNLATNLAAGLSRARPLPFFAGSLAGYLPQTLVFALLGSGFEVQPQLRMGLSVLLFVGSSALGVWLWRRYRRSRGLSEDDSLADDSA